MNKVTKKFHTWANQKDHKVFYKLIEKWFDFIGWVSISSLLLTAYFITKNLIFLFFNLISTALLSLFINFVLYTTFIRKIKIDKMWFLIFVYIVQFGVQSFLQIIIFKAIFSLFLMNLAK